METTFFLRLIVLLGTASIISAVFEVTPQYQFVQRSRRRWGQRRICYYRYTCYGPREVCYNKCYYYTEFYQVQVCADGYEGQECNVPICDKSCEGNGGVCVGKNLCDCPIDKIGSVCQSESCSAATDCYPGYCTGVGSSRTCQCDLQFDGDNCQIMKEGPIFDGVCRGSLIRNEIVGQYQRLAFADCTLLSESQNNNLTIYTNQRDFNKLNFDWTQTYKKLQPLSPYPDQGFVRYFQVGVINSTGIVKLRDTNGVELWSKPIPCPGSGTWLTPKERIDCKIDVDFNEGIAHRQEIDFVLTSQTGGRKEIRNDDGSGEYENKYFTGLSDTRVITFSFDLHNPVHCSQADNDNEIAECPPDDVSQFPIVTLQDITRNSTVTVLFLDWSDFDSQLYGYNYTVYRMAMFGDRLQENIDNPVTSGEYSRFDTADEAVFTLPSPGLYSIIGKIVDFANNFQYARAFVLYADPKNKIESLNKPWQVVGAVNQIGKTFWLDNLNPNITLNWTGCYENAFLVDNELLSPIMPWGEQFNISFLEYTLGNISVSGTNSSLGITNFEYGLGDFEVTEPGARRRRELTGPFGAWGTITPHTSTVYSLSRSTNRDGDSFSFWIKATDIFGNELIDNIFIRRDSSAPEFISATFVKNVPSPSGLGYYSSVDIVVLDDDSGIFQIDSSVFDITGHTPRPIGNRTEPGQMNNDVNCEADGTCDCTSYDECYNRTQRVYIDNCWFVAFMGVQAEFQATVFNRAMLGTTVLPLNLGVIENITGIGEYPAPFSFRVKRLFPYSVQVTWYLPIACYEFKTIHITLEGGGQTREPAALSPGAIDTEIDLLAPNTIYTAQIYISYINRRESDKVSLEFTTSPPPPGPEKTLSIGAIVGIVVGILVFIAIIVLVILIVIRVTKHQPPIPRRLTVMKNNIHDRISRKFGHSVRFDAEAGLPSRQHTKKGMTLNVAYASGPRLRDFEDDIYAYGEMETDPGAKWKHSNDHVVLGKTIQTGRFAEIRECTLQDSSGSRRVAAKLLRDHTPENELLMKAKMNFMATAVPNHNNIVNFVGAITEGPILLLELCDMSLKDWLKTITKVTDDVEDNMTNFATDIARGMQHLHDNEIVHRRLGARNVLLKDIPLMGRMVAKVTGFGPMKGEQKGESADAEKERIPIKWMAIEQLGIGKKKRPYDLKTDVWSFGVTMWEISSKGESPFGSKKHSEIRGMLESGERLQCPKYCSDDLYKEVMMPCWNKSPSKRPTFNELRGSLERLFHGAPDGDEYYGDESDLAGARQDSPPEYDDTMMPDPRYL